MSKFNFDKAERVLEPQIKTAAIKIMAASKVHFGKNFDKEGIGGKKWDEVARRTEGSPFNKRQIVGGINKASGKRFVTDQGDDYATRKILRGTTGRLRYKTERADSSITMNGAVSVMTNPLPYADAMNEGNAYTPARPFMKQDDELTGIQLAILKNETGKIFTKA